MFAPERMAEVTLFIYEDAIQPVILELARLGTLQIEEEDGAQEEARQGRWVSAAGTYGALERRLRELLAILAITPDEAAAPDGIDLEQDQQRIAALLDEAERVVMGWRRESDDVLQELERLHFLIEQMRLLAPLDAPVEQLANLHSLYLVIGAMPSANLARIQTALFRIPFVIIPVHTFATRTLVFAATPKSYAAILERALHSAFLQPIALPDDATGSPSQVLAELEHQRGAAQTRLKELQGRRSQLAGRWGESLRNALHRVQACRVLAETIQRLPVQGNIYVVAGWTPAARVAETVDAVQKITNGQAIIEVLEPEAERPHVPTQLTNPRILKGFEALVLNFGTPGYQELDPTWIVALSFVLMYGLMFGDVAHGLLLAVAGAWLTTRKGGLAGLSAVLISAGLSAALFGVFYGTVLGMPLLPALWLRPADNILTVLLTTLAGGIALLNVGFALFAVAQWRIRNWPRLALDKNGLAGFCLYWALLGGGYAMWRGMLSQRLWFIVVSIPALILLLREPLLLWLTEGKPKPRGTWTEYSVLAFFDLFETMLSFAGNSLSFVRLGAFAVAHEGMSQIVLRMADLSGGQCWLIVAIGTVFVVAFEGLIVGIQALRLEYYEFFGRFFRGDGSAFKPMRMPGIGRS